MTDFRLVTGVSVKAGNDWRGVSVGLKLQDVAQLPHFLVKNLLILLQYEVVKTLQKHFSESVTGQ